MRWEKEEPAKWDDTKESLLKKFQNSFNVRNVKVGDLLESHWYKQYNDDNDFVGYGWIDISDNGVELSIIIDDQFQNSGYGTIILDNLENEAIKMGFNEAIVIVKTENEIAEQILRWVYSRGFIPDTFISSNQPIEDAFGIVKRMPITLRKNFMKNAISNYYLKLDALWLEKRKSNPKIPFNSKMPEFMYYGEKSESGYISWRIHEIKRTFNFIVLDNKIGFNLNSEIKQYFSSYYFLMMKGDIDNIKINLTPITPLIDIETFFSERVRISKEENKDIQKIVIGTAEIDGADGYLINYDNRSGEVEIYDPEFESAKIISKSLVILINDLKPRC